MALELLDYHFADDKVRSLAVHRLEKLTNEELMLFLLQLTQVHTSLLWLSLLWLFKRDLCNSGLGGYQLGVEVAAVVQFLH